MSSRKKTDAIAESNLPTGLQPSVPAILQQRPLIGGESPAEYDQLFENLTSTYKPDDEIECLLLKDLTDCSWEILRLRKVMSDRTSEEFRDKVHTAVKPKPKPNSLLLDPFAPEEPEEDEPEEVPEKAEVADLLDSYFVGDKKRTNNLDSLLREWGTSLEEKRNQALVDWHASHTYLSLHSTMESLLRRRSHLLTDLQKHGAYKAWRVRQKLEALEGEFSDETRTPAK